MRLKKLTVTNWRCFRHKSVEFGNFTAISGPNGSGKSSLAAAIPFALLGVSPADRTEDNICQSAVAGEKVRVELEFSHAGSDYQVVREIKNSEARPDVLLKAGGVTIRGANAVRAKVCELLDIDDMTLSNYVFVPQWTMFSVLVKSETNRIKELAKLFGLERAEAIWKALGAARSTLPALVPALDLEFLEGTLSQQVDERSALVSRLTVKRDELQRAIEIKASLVDRFEKGTLRQKLSEQQHKIALQLAEQDSRMAKLRAEFADNNSKLEPLQNRAKLLAESFDRLRTQQEAWVRYQEQLSIVTRLENDIAETASTVSRLQKEHDSIGCDISPIARAAILAEIASREAAAVTAKKFLATYSSAKNIATCPTCGSEVSATLEKWQQTVNARAEMVDLEKSIAVNDAAVARKARIEVELSRHTARLEALRATKVATPEAVERPADYEQVNIDLALCNAHLHNVNAAVLAATVEMKIVEESRLQLIESLNEIDKKMADLPVESPGDLAELNRRIVLLAQLPVEVSAMELSLKVVEERINAVSAQLLKAKEIAEINSRRSGVMSVIDELRAAFHRNSAPAIVGKQKIAALACEIDLLLERFDSPFRLVESEGMDLSVRFADGRIGSAAAMLSGGQLMLLALAFRVALARSTEVGLLCLDEPTVGLDPANIKCVLLAVQRLRELSGELGLQFIVITHTAGLDISCDKIIDLADKAV